MAGAGAGHSTWSRAPTLLGALFIALALASCSSPGTAQSSRAAATTTSANNALPPTAPLAALQIDDNPAPDRPYSRDEWPAWEDIDGDGCDAREQALIAQSTTPAQVDPVGCKVVAGDWTSSYDGGTTSEPSSFDIDHVVPLENAHLSGGWRWDAGARRQFANDQSNLLAVSASSNRSKGSSPPDQWRPPNRASWCAMATTWLQVKVTYGLTATTSERDALGDMLSTCDGPV